MALRQQHRWLRHGALVVASLAAARGTLVVATLPEVLGTLAGSAPLGTLAEAIGLAQLPPVDSTIAALVRAPPVGGLSEDPVYPNGQRRITEAHLKKAYKDKAQMERQMSMGSNMMGMQSPNLSNSCASPQVPTMHSEAKLREQERGFLKKQQVFGNEYKNGKKAMIFNTPSKSNTCTGCSLKAVRQTFKDVSQKISVLAIN
ncbi:UNVERIFIED_CONTAM: hypothetical protein FKN15_013694 [Acipenser sinensis]